MARGAVRLGFGEPLAEVADGVRSNAEGDLRALMKRASLPAPMFNANLYVGDEFLASPDAWWRELGVAAEVDSKEWHLSPEDWEQTLARHARMTAQGILVLHFPPSKIRTRRLASDQGDPVGPELRARAARAHPDRGGRQPLASATPCPARPAACPRPAR